LLSNSASSVSFAEADLEAKLCLKTENTTKQA
jgi:hypothetical protein